MSNCVQKLLTGEIQSYSLEKRYIRKDGSIVWVEITPSLMRDQNHNQPQYFIVVIEEIEERKQAELKLQQKIEELAKTTQQLTKRNQELDQFTYVASHDLKAPLRAIAHISQWLEEDLAGYLTPENQRQLKILRGRVERMESLINGLLEYSRIGRVQYPVEEVEIELLIKQVIHSLAIPASFHIEIQSQIPIFQTKKVPLFQVLRKIIDNAIKHHDREDGKINVCVRDTGDFWEFSIRDDGIGIAPEYHQKIFTIFQTLEPRDKKENTGVGLSIVKKIVDLEGGEIQIKSQLGLGTEVIFTWPKFCEL
ncbi:sensor histidine kinase [Calothrix sp. NIES-3974]|uniref:sensor histidine kinase n=1 Tax=Calothrix sp. NIES-3974 TaxID=2005462 RepID=UPI000BBC9149|nr:ATP-binding protein [Calothrix sp. NIES-3974]